MRMDEWKKSILILNCTEEEALRRQLPSCQRRCSRRRRNLVTSPRSQPQLGHLWSANALLYHLSQ